VLENIVNSIKATLYDRTSSPLFGSFALSWAVWNYRVLVVLLGSGDFSNKLAFIDQQLYPHWWHVAVFGVAVPLVTAVAFIFVYPIPARWVYRYAANEHRKLRNLRKEIEGDELITEDEARKLRQDHVALQVQFDGQVKALKTERDTLSELAVQRQGMVDRLSTQVATLTEVEKERDSLAAELERTKSKLRSIEELREHVDSARAEAELRALDVGDAPVVTKDQVANTIWRLTFNPRLRNSQVGSKEGSKRVHLLADGTVGEGQNNNEHRWGVTPGGHLEFSQADGQVHSRFQYDKGTRKWLALHDPKLPVKSPNQYMEADRSG
jgi:hypothetical protein